jgi:hypothetical protein
MGGINAEREYRIDTYGPWWWLHSEEVIRSMCSLCGLRIVKEGENWPGHTLTLLCRIEE